MLSPKAREHGRETRVSIALQGDALAFAGHSPRGDLGKGSSQSRLGEQMAKTFRPTRHCRSSQSFAATASDANQILAKHREVDWSDAASLGETESWLGRRPCDPARVAQSEAEQGITLAVNHQARVAPAWLDCQIQPGYPGVFSQTLAGGVWQIARSGLDLSVSRRRSQDLCLSYLEFAHAHLHSKKVRDGPIASVLILQ